MHISVDDMENPVTRSTSNMSLTGEVVSGTLSRGVHTWQDNSILVTGSYATFSHWLDASPLQHVWFQGHGIIFMPIDALSVLCAQLTCDLFAIAKFLFLLDLQMAKWYVTSEKRTDQLIQKSRCSWLLHQWWNRGSASSLARCQLQDSGTTR